MIDAGKADSSGSMLDIGSMDFGSHKNSADMAIDIS